MSWSQSDSFNGPEYLIYLLLMWGDWVAMQYQTGISLSIKYVCVALIFNLKKELSQKV